MNQTTNRTGRTVFGLAGVALVALLCMGAINTGPNTTGSSSAVGTNIFTSTNANNTLITNVIRSLDLWTQDFSGLLPILRPVEQNRTIWQENVSGNESSMEITLKNTN